MAKQKKTKLVEDPSVVDFIAKLSDMEYLWLFLRTLEINVIESEYQAPMLPMIFLKTHDEYGIVMSYERNPLYNEMEIPEPPDKFTAEEAEAIVRSIATPERTFALEMMITAGSLEHGIMPGIIEDNGNQTCHLILKTVDKDGFPTAYRLNAEVNIEEI